MSGARPNAGFRCKGLRTRLALIAPTQDNCHIDIVKPAAALFLISSVLPTHALASLGDSVTSIRVDQPPSRSKLHSTDRGTYKIVQTDRDDGTIIKEYFNGAGVVFGVTWQARNVPNLEHLLGAYFSEFQRAIQARGHRAGPLMIRTKNLVVESGGHMRAFRGRAYVPSLLPQHLTAAVLQ